LAQRASVGSTEAAKDVVARFGVVGPTRAKRPSKRSLRDRSGDRSVQGRSLANRDSERQRHCFSGGTQYGWHDKRVLVRPLLESDDLRKSQSGQELHVEDLFHGRLELQQSNDPAAAQVNHRRAEASPSLDDRLTLVSRLRSTVFDATGAV
jgi:hypothetical protein